MVAGGFDINLNQNFASGMELMGASCIKFKDQPLKASRPFDRDRAGPVLGDGGALLLLESEETALKRGAKIIAEIKGYSQNSDAYHILRPQMNGSGAIRAMRDAIIEAEIEPS